MGSVWCNMGERVEGMGSGLELSFFTRYPPCRAGLHFSHHAPAALAMTIPLRLAWPGAMYHTTGRGNARAAIYAAAADRATVLILLLGRDKATLVDKESASSALSTLRGYPETLQQRRACIKQLPCGNEMQGNRFEKACSA